MWRRGSSCGRGPGDEGTRDWLIVVMNSLFKILLCCAIGATVAFAQEPFDSNRLSDFDRKVIGLAGHPASEATWFSEQNRDLVIQRLKLMRSMGDYTDRKEYIDITLVSLGDEDATARIAEKSIEGRGGVAASYMTEVALPYMVNAFYTADPNRMIPGDGGDVGGPSRKEGIMSHFFSIIRRSRLFTDETKQWALENFSLTTGLPKEEVEKKAELAQQWWEHNEEAVMAKDYRNATWLPATDKETRPVTMPDPADARRVLPPKTAGKQEAETAPPSANAPALAAVSGGKARSSESSSLLWVSAAASALATAAWLILRQRRKG